MRSRTADWDAPVSLAIRDAHLSAISTWGIPDETKLNRLAGITQPVLVANGRQRHDGPRPEHLPAGRAPTDARLSIYPDAGHGFLF